MGRGETPGLRAGAKRRPDAAQAPETPIRPRSAALELSASCVRAGFPPAPRRGRRGRVYYRTRRREGPRPGRRRRPAARGTAGKNFLKKVLDTAGRAR